MARAGSYGATRARVETYFDRTATKVWAQLTSDAPVSKVRQTVRAGREEMRAMILSRLPQDMTGLRILDAGCGPGVMTIELAKRGAEVVALDISPQLIEIAKSRLPEAYAERVSFHVGDMMGVDLGTFDHVIAMDSLIYYDSADIQSVLARFAQNTRGKILFSVAPKTPFLMAFWAAGKLFPRSDSSPRMQPQSLARLARGFSHPLTRIGRVQRGFYISECLEVAL